MQGLSDFLFMKPLADLVIEYSWFWPICEILHFLGLALLVGITGLFDLRLLGLAKSAPVAPLHRLLPWAVAGFGLCLATGVVFVCGNSFKEPIVLLRNLPFQLKMLFIGLAGANVAIFYLSPLHRAVRVLGPGQDAPLAAKAIAATSLLLWIGVMYFGRMIPWEDALYYAFGL